MAEIPELQIIDYKALMLFLDGRKPAWDTRSLSRCVAAKLVTPSGNFLTIDGEKKAKALRQAIEDLRHGMPLSARNRSRAVELTGDGWLRTEIESDVWSVCASAAFKGRLATSRHYLASPKILHAELRGYRDNGAHLKLVPYAVQIDEFGANEFVCMHSLIEKDKIYRRIDSRYYDYAIEEFDSVTFWTTEKDDIVIVKRSIPTKRMNFAGIVAIIQGINLKRPFPPRSINHGMAPKITSDKAAQQVSL